MYLKLSFSCKWFFVMFEYCDKKNVIFYSDLCVPLGKKNIDSATCCIWWNVQVKLLMKVRHKNLVSFVGYCDNNNKMAIIYEYEENSSLDRHLSTSNNTFLYNHFSVLSFMKRKKGVNLIFDYFSYIIKIWLMLVKN